MRLVPEPRSATGPGTPRFLELSLFAAILFAPTAYAAGVVLLLLGHRTAGIACLAGGIAYRLVTSLSVRLCERRPPRAVRR